MRILFVEDDAMLGRATVEGLETMFAVDWFRTSQDGLAAAQSTPYDLLILDISLPDGSGLDILKALRDKHDPRPILLLTARDAVEHRIQGLNAGADDYLVKPFDLDELLARSAALIRRSQGRANPVIVWRHITYDPAARSVTRDGEPVSLSGRELAVLNVLMTHIGKLLSKSQIEDRIYDWSQEVESNTVEVHISALRRKLGKDLIQTVRGVGYMVPPP